jgi:hypothetical protein
MNGKDVYEYDGFRESEVVFKAKAALNMSQTI